MTFALTSRKRVGAVCLTVLAVSLFALSPLATVAQAQTQPTAPSVDQRNPPAAPQPTPQAESGADAHQVTKDGSAIYTELGYQILSLFAWFTGIAGVLLNAAIYYTVVTMADFVNSLGAILTSWKIIRDLGNIALIFGFVAIGIATILDVQSYNAKKMLVKLIIVAVTVNFSLFAARAIIDVGNVFAFQFYSQMINTKGGSQIGTAEVDVTSEGVSNAIMQMVGLQKFYDASTVEKAQRQQLADNSFFAFILGSLLFIIAAFVMFAIAFMLIARFVILVFLMILSPIGFVGLIVPTLEKRAADWWRTLIAQSAVAPIMLLMILVSVNLMTDTDIFGLAGGGKDFKAAFQGDNSANDWLGTTNMILGFLISMGFLMASVIVAKQMGVSGANFAIGASRRLVGIALAPISVPARAGGAAVVRHGGDKGLALAEAMYNKSGLAAGLRSIGLKTLDADIQHKFEGRKEIKVDGRSLKDEETVRKHREHQLHRDHTIGTLGTLLGAIGLADDSSRKDAEKNYSKTLQGLSSADTLEYMKGLNAKDRMDAAKYLSTERYIDLQKTDKMDEGMKAEIASGRYEKLAAAITGRSKAEVQRWSSKDMAEFAKINATAFEDALNADLLSDDQRDALEKSEALTNDQRRQVKDSSDFGKLRVLIENDDGSPAYKANITLQARTLGPKAKVKLGTKDYTRPEVIHSFTQVDLQRGMADGKFAKPKEIITELRAAKAAGKLTPDQIEGINNYLINNDFDRGLFGLEKGFTGL